MTALSDSELGMYEVDMCLDGILIDVFPQRSQRVEVVKHVSLRGQSVH